MAKTRAPPLLEEIFSRFPAALIETHGKDLTVSADPSRSGTPAPASAASTTSAATVASATPSVVPAVKKEAKKVSVNSATVTVDASFMAAADDLFSLLTDEKRIPAWTRAPAQVNSLHMSFLLLIDCLLQSAAKPDTDYSLFGGGVKGKYISLDAPTKIVQTWALQSPTWPSGGES